MSYYVDAKYRILNSKIDVLYNSLKDEIIKLKDENNALINQANNRLNNISSVNTYNIQTINKTTNLLRQLEHENSILRLENETKDIVINNLRRQLYK